MAKTPLALVVVLLCAASLAAADLGSAHDLTPQQESAEIAESTSRSDDTTSNQPDTSGYQAARQSAESSTAVPDASPTKISLLVLPSTAESLVADVDAAEGDELQSARNRRSRLFDSMQASAPNSESTAAPPLQLNPSSTVVETQMKPQSPVAEPQLAGRDTNPGGETPSGLVSAGATQAHPLSVDGSAAAPPLQVDHAPPSTAVSAVALSIPPLQRLAAEDTQETGDGASTRVAPEPLPSPVSPTPAQPNVDVSPIKQPPPRVVSTSAPVVIAPLPAPAPEAEPDRSSSQLMWHEVPRDVGTGSQPSDSQVPPSDRSTAAPSRVSEDSNTIRSELQQPRHAASQTSAAVISVGSGGSRLATDGSGSEAYDKDPVVGRPFRGNSTISDKRLPKPTRTPKNERGTTSSASRPEFRLLTAAGVAGLVAALLG